MIGTKNKIYKTNIISRDIRNVPITVDVIVRTQTAQLCPLSSTLTDKSLMRFPNIKTRLDSVTLTERLALLCPAQTNPPI